MYFDLAQEIANISIRQYKHDLERRERIFEMDKPKAKAIMKLLSEPITEALMGHAGLTEDERDAVCLCIRKGVSQEEAADRMHVSVKTVQRETKAALEKLVLLLTYLCLIFRAVNEGD